MKHTIDSIVKANLCTGCGACAGLFEVPAATMALTADGFLRPQPCRPLNAEESQRFQSICPGAGLAHPSRDARFHTLWGPVIESLTGYAKDDTVRHQGSSGGVISALAIHLLETQQVDGVVHIAPSTDHPFNNRIQTSTTREEVLRAAGSRYAPAAPLADLHGYLSRPGRFAFIGKPCDIAAMRAIQRQNPAYTEKFPYLLSFMCAGTPSMQGTEAVVRHMGLKPEEVVRFRYRGNGWPGMARAETKDGSAAEMDYQASWGQILNRHLQFRCKICPDGTGEFADITCADAWHGDDKGYPSFEESAGRSLILARTEAGQRLIQQALAQGAIAVEPLPIAQIAAMQPYQVTRKQALIARLIGARAAFKAIPRYDRLGLIRAAQTMSFSKNIRNALGTWARCLKG